MATLVNPAGPDGDLPAPLAPVSAVQGRTVPLRDAERELNREWRALDEEVRREGGEGLLRLREANMVVACSHESLAESRRTAALVTQEHPARLILIVVDRPHGQAGGPDAPSEAAAGALAPIATACLVDESSGHHVCSEEVLIQGDVGEEESLRAAVLQLLVPDLPVLGWWSGDLAGHASGLRWLAGISDQLVTDLRRCREPLAGLQTLEELTRETGDIRLRELEWLRSAHWRTLTAELFEQRENRALIPRVTHLEVEHDDAPLQALLYGAWFASRLGLHAGRKGWWVEGGSLCAALRASGRAVGGPDALPTELIMQLRPAADSGREQRGLAGIRIRSRSADGGQEPSGQAVTLRRWPHSCLCSVAVGPEEHELVVKSLRPAEQEDHRLLSRVVDTPFRDQVLLKALLLAGELARQPGFDPEVLTMGGAEGPSTWSSA